MPSTVSRSSSSLRGFLSFLTSVSSLQPMTLREWTWDPETLALIGPNDQDRPAAYWYCMYGNCHRTLRACARRYRSMHGTYGHVCPERYTFEHRRASTSCRWNWYLYDHIDLHMGGTTLQLHEAALRRLARKTKKTKKED